MKRTIEITVGKEKIEIDLAALEVGDISEDMETVASSMAYFGWLWALAVEEQEAADAAYRSWRASVGETLMTSDPKLAEWKVKQAIESSAKFTQFKNAIAACMRNESLLRSVYESYRVKASVLQSKGAMMRAELESTGMHTPTSERRAASEDKVQALRERNATKQQGKTRVRVDG